MSEKHTTERWIAKEALQSAYEMGETWEIVTAAQGKPIALVRDSQANARLIAAAPELLDACVKQHQVIDALLARLIGLDEKFMPSKSPYWPVVVQGHAVIAKARGQ